MVQYYYVKYNVVSTPTYSYNVAWSASSNSGYTSASGYTSYSIDGSGKIVLGGSYLTIQQYTSYGTVYTESGSALIRHTIGSHDNVIYETWGSVQKTQTGTTYSRGSLVQSNIVAEDGTYPANGRHTDGYWYVKGTVVNTAPTMPGAFTQPSGNLEIGDSKVFAVGTASDAEGNLSKYIWEASINGGHFQRLGKLQQTVLRILFQQQLALKCVLKLLIRQD